MLVDSERSGGEFSPHLMRSKSKAMDHYTTLHSALLQQCPESSAQWLIQALKSIESAPDPSAEHQIPSAMARRKLGDGPFKVTLVSEGEASAEISHWSCSDAARILLTLALVRVTEQALSSLLSEVYAHGDERERAALLMGLSLLDQDGQWSIEAEDCCRTNSLILLAAIGMMNPYPAGHFSSRAFNQLALKSLFLGLNIANIQGLRGRRNSELSMMCAGFIDERVAAGRDYPISIWLAIRLSDCAPDTCPHMAASLISDDANRRYYAAASLLQQEGIPAAIRDKIDQQLQIEVDNRIREVLQILSESKRMNK